MSKVNLLPFCASNDYCLLLKVTVRKINGTRNCRACLYVKKPRNEKEKGKEPVCVFKTHAHSTLSEGTSVSHQPTSEAR